MEFHFYLPESYLPDADRQEAWRCGHITRLEKSGKIASAQCWIFQTWLALETKWLSGASHAFDALGWRAGDAYQLRGCGFSFLQMAFFLSELWRIISPILVPTCTSSKTPRT